MFNKFSTELSTGFPQVFHIVNILKTLARKGFQTFPHFPPWLLLLLLINTL
nr:hypothetical protein JQWJAGXB_JQWJAGXB_CDS_0008 [Microvirus sp.]